MNKTKMVVVAAASALLAGCGQIDTGYTGFKTSFGRVDSEPLGPGLWFVSPIGGAVVKYDCREQRLDIKTMAYTKDVQSANFEVTVLFAVDSSRVIDLHTTVGETYVKKLLAPAVTKSLKAVIGQWEADKLISGREKATDEIFSRVTDELSGKPLHVNSVVISNIDYSDVFEKAIEDKQVAAQNAIRAQNRTREVEEEARQRLITAKAEAESMQIRGDALRANPGLVQLEAVSKWDGKAPATLVVGDRMSQILPLK